MTSEHSRELAHLRTDSEYMRFLVAAGELLSSSLDYRTTLRTVCAAAVQTVADICILDLGSTNDVEQVAAAHRDPANRDELGDRPHFTNEPGRPLHPVCRVLDTGRTFFAPQIDDEWIERNASNTQHAAFMRRMRYRSVLVVPVRSQIWGVTGALTLVRTDENAHQYDESAIPFAEDLGRRCGIAIGKARLHSQTVDIAERFQKASLPQSLPNHPDLTFDVLYEPADAALLVGGDWYDAFELRDGRIAISIGDVSGHGVESAAQMSSIRNAIRMALVMESDLRKVLIDADFLFRNEVADGTFCTALVAVIDPSCGEMTFARAGHPAPLIWSRGTVVEPQSDPGLPLAFGSLAAEAVEPARVKLEPGCSVLFYTDGLIEWEHAPVLGLHRLREALGDAATRNAAHPARSIRQACVTGAHADDIALLVVRYQRNK